MRTRRRLSWGVVSLAVVVLADTLASCSNATAAQPLGINEAASMAGIPLEHTKFMLYPFGAIVKGTIWNKPGWTPNGNKPLMVCWESLTDTTPADRELVKAAAQSSWAHYGMIQFEGWTACSSTNSPDIRIGLTAGDSGTQGLGNQIQGKKNGMLLRFDYTAFKFCMDKDKTNKGFCLKANTVHEFGHVVGLAHEDQRLDAPDWCKENGKIGDTLGQIPNQAVTPPDKDSIMNYCNDTWNNDGLLSNKDIDSVVKLYGGRA